MALAINKNIARGLNTMGYWVGTLFQITPDNSYPTGGYSFPAALLKLGVIEYMAPVFCANAAALSASRLVTTRDFGKVDRRTWDSLR